MIVRMLLGWMLLAAAFLRADIGTVLAYYDVPCAQPFGLTMLPGRLLIADRATALLYAFSLEARTFSEAGRLPCSQPLGITSDDKGLWMYDAITKHIYHYLIDKKRVDYVLTDVEAEVEGLAWDGSILWATAGKQFLKVDPFDGTTISSFDGPGPDTTGIAFDGSYLWLAERQKDRLAVALPDGTLFGTLPSPGPYPTGIARTEDSLWVLDFQERRLYELDIAPQAHPYYTGAPHRRTVHFTDALVNRGPSADAAGRIYACVGEADAHQKILSPAVYSPAGAVSFVNDLWRQQFALCEGPIPAGKRLRLEYTVGVETRDLNWFLLPEWVKPLEAIPQDIRSAYLADGAKLGISDPFIRDLAKKIVGNETNPFWMAFRLHQYLHTALEYQRTGGWNKASTILKRGNGSCSEFTFAYMALARAAGLPARYEAGIVVRGDDGSIDDVYHRWTQVYLPPFGWVPADPSKGKPATAMDVASSFGSLSHRFFITTHSGGDSPILGWTYNYRSFYEFSGVADVVEQNEAKWDPVTEEKPGPR